MIKEDQMIITKDNGDEEIVNILFTHEANGKNYVVFEFSESHEISAAVYVPDDNSDEGTFEDIQTDAEWDMLDRILQEYFDDLEIDEELDEDEEDVEEDEVA